jgi:hypothetical protein
MGFISLRVKKMRTYETPYHIYDFLKKYEHYANFGNGLHLQTHALVSSSN